MLYRPFAIVIALCLSFFTATAVHAEVIIDDFGDGSVTLHRELGESVIYDTQSGLSTDSVIGGSRSIHFGVRDFVAGATGGATVEIDTIPGVLNYTTDPGMTVANFDIIYGSLNEPLGADLTAEGNDRFRFEFSSAAFSGYNDKGGIQLIVSTVNDDHEWWSGSAVITIPTSESPFHLDVSFSELQGHQPCALDFSRVISIRYGSSNGYLPGTFILDRIVAVPEPSAVFLGCLGLVFLAWWRR